MAESHLPRISLLTPLDKYVMSNLLVIFLVLVENAGIAIAIDRFVPADAPSDASGAADTAASLASTNENLILWLDLAFAWGMAGLYLAGHIFAITWAASKRDAVPNKLHRGASTRLSNQPPAPQPPPQSGGPSGGGGSTSPVPVSMSVRPTEKMLRKAASLTPSRHSFTSLSASRAASDLQPTAGPIRRTRRPNQRAKGGEQKKKKKK